MQPNHDTDIFNKDGSIENLKFMCLTNPHPRLFTMKPTFSIYDYFWAHSHIQALRVIILSIGLFNWTPLVRSFVTPSKNRTKQIFECFKNRMRPIFFLFTDLFQFIVDFIDVAAVLRVYPIIGNCRMDSSESMLHIRFIVQNLIGLSHSL